MCYTHRIFTLRFLVCSRMCRSALRSMVPDGDSDLGVIGGIMAIEAIDMVGII